MATLTVTTNADSGTGSLRQALLDASAGDTITFASTLAGKRITLSSSLTVANDVTIIGLTTSAGLPNLTIDGNGYALFNYNGPIVVSNIRLLGRIRSQNASGSSFANCVFYGFGISGASSYLLKFEYGSGATRNISFTDCTFDSLALTNNANPNACLTISGLNAYLTRCTFSNNTGPINGKGAVLVTDGILTIDNCNFSNNKGGVLNGSPSDVLLTSTAGSSYSSGVYLAGGNDIKGMLATAFSSGTSLILFNEGYNGINNYSALSGNLLRLWQGSGHLAINASQSMMDTDVTFSEYGAGVSNISATGAAISWASTDSTKSVLIQKESGGSWTDVSTSATSPFTATDSGNYRIWDGATFLTESVVIPQTLVVTNTNDSGSGSLRAVLASARAVDTVTFDPSLSGSTITLASGLTLSDDVTIVGLTDANGDPAITISGANTYRILSGNYQMTLSNLIFTNAGNNAIYNEDANGSTFTNCVFSNNSATDSYGGAVLLMGVNATTDSVSFTDCVFSNNESNRTSVNGYGGALTFSSLSATLSGCTFEYNTAYGEIGGAVAAYGPLTITDCAFTGNASTAMLDEAQGGAVYAATSVTATRCTFTGNSSTNGAAVNTRDGTFTNCTFGANNATVNGGGVYLTDGSITGCTFEYNGSSTGGGVYITGGVGTSVIVSGCTYTSNTASNGDDVYVDTNGGLYVPSGIITIPNVYAASGSAISIANGAALSVSNSATITGSVGATTRGYLATPPGTDLTGATLTNIVACDYGAGVSAFSIDEDGADWTATNSNISVLLEKKVIGAWQTLAQPTGTSYSTTFVDGDEARIFDGVQFRTASAVIPATLVVTNTNATGAGSLAQAVLDARAVDTITFDPSLAGETITLNAGLGPRNEITIVGLTDDDGNPAIVVDGNDNYAFNSSYPVHILNIAFNGGWGAFSSLGGFDGSTFENCTFENMDLNVFELSNSSPTSESLSFTDCIFTSNDAADMLIIGNVNATLSGGNVLTEGLDLTDAGTVVINNAGYNGVGGYTAPTTGTASVAGSGNIALPPAAVVTTAATVTRSDYGALISDASSDSLTISWDSVDSTKSVLLEVQNGSDWDFVDDDATSPTTVSTSGTYRIWDGINFLTVIAEKKHYWIISSGAISGNVWRVKAWAATRGDE